MLEKRERRRASRTIEGWAHSVLLEAGAIHECEEHGWAKGYWGSPRSSKSVPLGLRGAAVRYVPNGRRQGPRGSLGLDRRCLSRMSVRDRLSPSDGSRHRVAVRTTNGSIPSPPKRGFKPLFLLFPAIIFLPGLLFESFGFSLHGRSAFPVPRLASSSAACAFPTACFRRSCSFCLAASSLIRSRSRRLCSC